MMIYSMPDGTPVKRYCREHGLCYQTIWYRLRDGMTIDKALKMKINHCHRRFYKGRPLKDLCGGVKSKSYRRISNRMYNGYTLEEAVEMEGNLE